MDKLILGPELVLSLQSAFTKAGWSERDIAGFCSGDLPRKLLDVYRGSASIVFGNIIVSSNTQPYLPPGWQIKTHIQTGEVQVDFNNFEFRPTTDPADLDRGMNACFLDIFLKYPDSIPERLRKFVIHFPGTRYIGRWNRERVRTLYFTGNHWKSSSEEVFGPFGPENRLLDGSCIIALLR